MSKLKKYSFALVFVICLLCVFLCGSALAEETDNGVSYTETPVYVDGLLSCRGYMIGDESYVSLEAACAVLGYNADVNYDKEINKLTVEVAGITIEAGFEDEYLCANGRYLYLPDGYMEVDGSFIIRARPWRRYSRWMLRRMKSSELLISARQTNRSSKAGMSITTRMISTG